MRHHYTEARGPSLKKTREWEREKNLHHLRIYGHVDGTPDSPRWIVEHHGSENEGNPAEHEFDNGQEMLAHVAEHASVPSEAEMPAEDGGGQ
jgi:hypothetical protein